MSTKPDSIRLEMTCGACPEQYEVFIGARQIGYLRLRHGYFRVECPDCMGEMVYEAEPVGDGRFMDDERDRYLNDALDAIMRWTERNA